MMNYEDILTSMFGDIKEAGWFDRDGKKITADHADFLRNEGGSQYVTVDEYMTDAYFALTIWHGLSLSENEPRGTFMSFVFHAYPEVHVDLVSPWDSEDEAILGHGEIVGDIIAQEDEIHTVRDVLTALVRDKLMRILGMK